MRHAVIGAGNLGLDIFNELNYRGEQAAIFSAGNGFDVTDLDTVTKLLRRRAPFDVVWYCVGGASVKRSEAEPELSQLLHVGVPGWIMQQAPAQTRLVFFSSDAVADEDQPSNPYAFSVLPRSAFAVFKLALERLVLEDFRRPRTAVVRVGSLFGNYKATECFPGKMIARFGFDHLTTMRIPSNLVTPTPTLWAASLLVDEARRGALFHDGRPLAHHCAPDGNLSLWDWATFILDGLRDSRDFCRDVYYDQKRPLISALGCSFIAKNWHWYDVWETYFRQRWFTPRERLRDLPHEKPSSGGRETPA